jgi:uncharacterized glyoxalase superfamily protein PhnB
MITAIIPKIPMRNKAITIDFYTKQLGFEIYNTVDYDNYIMFVKDSIQIHFFEFKDLKPLENYGQVYIRMKHIDAFYKTLIENNTQIHPNGQLQTKPWGQREFSLLDPDYNLLTFGETI